jgi:hypothetical protein
MQTIDQQLTMYSKMNGFKLILQVRLLKFKLKRIKQSRLQIKEDNLKQKSSARFL